MTRKTDSHQLLLAVIAIAGLFWAAVTYTSVTQYNNGVIEGRSQGAREIMSEAIQRGFATDEGGFQWKSIPSCNVESGTSTP